MGWDTDLQDASFRGVHFECTSVDDGMSKTLAIKQAPYSNKASIEDMGNDPTRISVNAIYSGTDYKQSMDALVAALRATGAGELIHPIHGIMNVYVNTYRFQHDANDVDYCAIAIEFVEAEAKEKPLFIPVTTPATIAPSKIIDTPTSALEKVLDKLKLSDNNKLFETVNRIRNGLETARKYMGIVKEGVEDILSPKDWAVGLVDDITKLVTFDTNISAISQWRDVINRVNRFEKLFQDDKSPDLQQTWRATYIASNIAVAQQVVSTTRKEMAENRTISFNPLELAVVRQSVRKALQQAINVEREGSSFENIAQIQVYKEAADQIHLQIQELIETRPPITKVRVPVPCTLHWLAHYLYQDMSRADEILRLNQDLMNPAVLQAGMEVTVYAR